jgi:succinate dehydrogenase / fumarate reductase membrane anchor subunit
VRRPLGGLQPWLVQRLSAVFMLAFIGFVLAHFVLDPPNSYVAWRSWVGSTGVNVAAVLFAAALLTHAWVGLRDVILDYVAPLAARITALALLAAALLASAAWIVGILWLGRA